MAWFLENPAFDVAVSLGGNMNIKSLVFGLVTGGVLCFQAVAGAETVASSFSLQSNAFTGQEEIPTKFTCEGEDVSPQLSWSGVPPQTKSLVLIVDDPDAPGKTWVHWVLYNIPPTVNELPENINTNNLPRGIEQGKNSWNKTGYGGPCPPRGRHRYFFKLYALNRMLPDLDEPDKNQLEAVMQDAVIDKAVLVGTYRKKSKRFIFF